MNPESATIQDKEAQLEPAFPSERPSYMFGWIHVGIAALAMVATLPGRTHGLGLITEPLLATFPSLSRVEYANINFWATILGALFCIPVGWLIDRVGLKSTLSAIVLALGIVVVGIASTSSTIVLAGLIFLSRGFGQSALSVASISLLGRAFPQRVRIAPMLYSVMVGVLFSLAFPGMGYAITSLGWQRAWVLLGITLIILAPIFWFLVRSGRVQTPDATESTHNGMSYRSALAEPTFWVFAVGTSLYGLAASGLGLFHQAILEERGFDAQVYYKVMGISMLAGVVSQLVCGAVVFVAPFRVILGAGLFVYAAAVALLPSLTTYEQILGYAIAMGAAGGGMTLCFFGVWRDQFGERDLGRITGIAQAGTVFASAVGPVLFANCKQQFQSYSPALWTVAIAAVCLGLIAFIVPGTKFAAQKG